MDNKINFNFKKLTPMKYRHNKTHINNYFIKLNNNDNNNDNWFELKELYNIIEYGNKVNPITNEKIDEETINKIKYLYYNIIETTLNINKFNKIDKIDKSDKEETKLLTDSLEFIENQIDELYNFHEQIYSSIQEHQYILEQLQSKNNLK
jgi:hypothetical protein